jgi:peptidoglycan/LPS O-acetylase OafA/YrhL
VDYRKDIQILRGIAVSLVVLYHLGIARFASGFLGVDVFFVISGYLMARLYDPARTKDFFARRAKRLLPAYFVTIIVTLIAAAAITAPSDYRQVISQSIFAAVFGSNIEVWLGNSYFNKEMFRPLLHFWSLGVEIQFYLLVPLLYWLFRVMRVSYALMLVGSLALCFALVTRSPETSFFMMPLRLWEFLIGFGVAKRASGGASLPWVGFAGLVAIICIPLIPIDGTAKSIVYGHPGLISLLICLATAVVLACGIPKVIENAAGTLATLGDYSYSIYLTHFPITVLFLYQPLSGTILQADIGQAAMILALVAAASWLMYHGVEQRLRKAVNLQWSVVAVCAVLAVGWFGQLAQRLTTPEKDMLIYQAYSDRSAFRCGSMLWRVMHLSDVSCEVMTVERSVHRIMLVGNSHADSIKTVFALAAVEKRVAVDFLVSNNPLMAGGINAYQLLQEAKARQVDSIVMHFSPDAVDASTVQLVASLAATNKIQFSFVMPVPVWGRSVPKALLSNDLPVQTIDDYRQANARLIADLVGAKFKIYHTADVMCPGACLAEVAGRPLYFDGGHLTLTGAGLLRPLFDQIIGDALTGGEKT